MLTYREKKLILEGKDPSARPYRPEVYPAYKMRFRHVTKTVKPKKGKVDAKANNNVKVPTLRKRA